VEAALSAEHEVDAVLVAGDLFDSPQPEARDRQRVIEGLERLVAGSKPVVLLPGLYDGIFAPRSVYYRFPFPEGVILVDWTTLRRLSIQLGDETLEVHARAPFPGADHQPVVARDEDEGDRPGYRVGLAYEIPEGMLPDGMWRPTVDHSELRADDLDLLVVGGHHSFRADTSGPVPIVSPGTPVALGPGEWGERYWVFAELTPDGVDIVKELRDVSPVTEVRLDLNETEIESPASLARHLQDRFSRDAMISLRLRGHLQSAWDEDDLRNRLDALPFAVSLIDETTLGDWRIVESLAAEDTLRGRFAQEILALRDPDPDSVNDGILAKAFRMGLREFRRFEECHVD
jgi:hypothetical protein